jgi:hypothetical protein
MGKKEPNEEARGDRNDLVIDSPGHPERKRQEKTGRDEEREGAALPS